MPNIVMINIYSTPGASRPTHQLPAREASAAEA